MSQLTFRPYIRELTDNASQLGRMWVARCPCCDWSATSRFRSTLRVDADEHYCRP